MEFEMTSQTKATASLKGWNIVGSGGGAPAAQTSSGAYLACEIAGIEPELVGGVSGSNIALVPIAGGMPAAELVAKMVKFDAASLFKKNVSVLDKLWSGSELHSEASADYSLHKGLLNTAGLCELMNTHAPVWPEKLWTAAVSDKHLYVFNKDGVRRVAHGEARINDSAVEWLQTEPAPVGLAVCASSAFPGVFESVEFHGVRLWDGCLGDYGDCPTQLVQDLFGRSACKTIAFDISHVLSFSRRTLFGAARILTGRMDQKWPRVARSHELFISPSREGLGGPVQFTLTPQLKQAAVLAGFRAGVKTLSHANLLTGPKLTRCEKAGVSYAELERLYIAPAI